MEFSSEAKGSWILSSRNGEVPTPTLEHSSLWRAGGLAALPCSCQGGPDRVLASQGVSAQVAARAASDWREARSPCAQRLCGIGIAILSWGALRSVSPPGCWLKCPVAGSGSLLGTPIPGVRCEASAHCPWQANETRLAAEEEVRPYHPGSLVFPVEPRGLCGCQSRWVFTASRETFTFPRG